MDNCNLETSFGFEVGQTPPLKEIDGPGPRQWFALRKEFTFQLKIAPDVLIWNITIPKGFITDLASIPRLFWIVFPPLGKWNRAAILHDYLYSIPECSSFLADTIFREAMAQLKVPVWRRVVMYYAVRVYSVLGFRHRRLKCPVVSSELKSVGS
jgi:hypothetical protein